MGEVHAQWPGLLILYVVSEGGGTACRAIGPCTAKVYAFRPNAGLRLGGRVVLDTGKIGA